MITLAITGAHDSHRGPAFLGGQMVRGTGRALEVLFCRFPHRFRDFCEGFGCFRRIVIVDFNGLPVPETYYGFQTVCKCPFRALLVIWATDSNQTWAN